MVEDRRQDQRRRTFKGGKIIFNDDRSAIDCVIKNLSTTGAALHVESTVGIPAEFKLLATSDNMIRSCRVAWTTQDQLGVAFED